MMAWAANSFAVAVPPPAAPKAPGEKEVVVEKAPVAESKSTITSKKPACDNPWGCEPSPSKTITKSPSVVSNSNKNEWVDNSVQGKARIQLTPEKMESAPISSKAGGVDVNNMFGEKPSFLTSSVAEDKPVKKNEEKISEKTNKKKKQKNEEEGFIIVEIVKETKSSEKKEVTKKDLYDNVQKVSVSATDLNTIILPMEISKVNFASNTPLQPIMVIDKSTNEQKSLPYEYLEGGRGFKFRFDGSAKGLYQIVVEYANGGLKQFYVEPTLGPGVIAKLDGATDPIKAKNKNSPLAVMATPYDGAVKMIQKFIDRGPDEGFQNLPVGQTFVFNKFVLKPIKVWTDNSYVIKMYQLISRNGSEAYIHPSDFFTEGVLTVVIDNDFVNEQNSPLIYVVEGVSYE